MLYRSTDRLSRGGAPMKNLAHTASFESLDKDAPSKPRTEHLEPRPRFCGRPSLYQFRDGAAIAMGETSASASFGDHLSSRFANPASSTHLDVNRPPASHSNERR